MPEINNIYKFNKIIMDTYTLTEKIEELQRFLDFVNERDK
jgi:hypothetical protein